MKYIVRSAAIGIAICAMISGVSWANIAAPDTSAQHDATQVEDIVVSARRSGLPMWTVRRGDEGVLILAGLIREAPRDFSWQSQALEQAVGRVDRVLLPQEGRASAGDVLRLIWRSRSIVQLPQGTTVYDYMPFEDAARLEALKADDRNDNWRRTSLLLNAMDLIQTTVGARQSRDPEVVRTAERAARRARITTHHIGVVRGSELIDTLISAPPQTHMQCLEAAMQVAEYGPTAVADRATAWAALDVPAVMASPVDLAMDVCWPWGDPEVRPRARQEWVNAIGTAIADDGVTLAIAPVRTLGEPGGVLDQLVAAGFEIDGPAWSHTPQ